MVQILQKEKKHRTKEKRLNLLGKNNVESQLFSLERVQTAKIYQEEKECVVIQEKAEKVEQRAEAAAAQ